MIEKLKELISCYRSYEEEGVVGIMPAHNEEKVIRRSLEKVLKLDLQKIIVVCDNCNDSTSEIVREISDDRIVIIEREGNPGKINALLETKEFLLREKPQFVFLVDADTRPEVGYLKDLVAIMEKDKNLVAVAGKINFIPANSTGKIGTFPSVINSIHGNEKLGGGWIPGGCSLLRTANFLAGYELIKEFYPDSKIEDVLWQVIHDIAGYKTRIVDISFNTLAPSGEGFVQMERWLSGLSQIEGEFGLPRGLKTANILSLIAYHIFAILKESKSLSGFLLNLLGLVRQVPFIPKYIAVKMRKGDCMGSDDNYHWASSR